MYEGNNDVDIFHHTTSYSYAGSFHIFSYELISFVMYTHGNAGTHGITPPLIANPEAPTPVIMFFSAFFYPGHPVKSSNMISLACGLTNDSFVTDPSAYIINGLSAKSLSPA